MRGPNFAGIFEEDVRGNQLPLWEKSQEAFLGNRRKKEATRGYLEDRKTDARLPQGGRGGRLGSGLGGGEAERRERSAGKFLWGDSRHGSEKIYMKRRGNTIQGGGRERIGGGLYNYIGPSRRRKERTPQKGRSFSNKEEGSGDSASRKFDQQLERRWFLRLGKKKSPTFSKAKGKCHSSKDQSKPPNPQKKKPRTKEKDPKTINL